MSTMQEAKASGRDICIQLVASILLCYMIKLLAGKYKDQLAMHPRAQLTASKKCECYLEVAALLKVSLKVTANSGQMRQQTKSFYGMSIHWATTDKHTSTKRVNFYFKV